MTDAQETCTRNLRKLTCASFLYVCHADLQQDFSRASFSHQIEPVLFYARNLQSRDSIHAHWLDTRGVRKPPASVDASFLHEKLASKIWCKFLVQVFGASFLYKFLVRLSRALHNTKKVFAFSHRQCSCSTTKIQYCLPQSFQGRSTRLDVKFTVYTVAVKSNV